MAKKPPFPPMKMPAKGMPVKPGKGMPPGLPMFKKKGR